MITLALSVLAVSMLSACGGGEDASKANLMPVAQSVTLSGLKQWLPVDGSFNVSDADNDSLTIVSIQENGKTITATNNEYPLSSGVLLVIGTKFRYIPTAEKAVQLTYTVSDGKATASATLTFAAAASDPLVSQQWHLQNTGQLAYSQNVAGIRKFLMQSQNYTEEQVNEWLTKNIKADVSLSGQDMNVPAAYAQGATGQGVVAVVVDTGLEISHEDLAANVAPNRSLNMVDGVTNITDPTNTNKLGDHGTSVAGLIAAEGWNGIGGRGVAPDTKLIGMNFLSSQTVLNQALSHGTAGSGIVAADNVIFNRSYGIGYPAIFNHDDATEDLQKYTATQLRQGLGAINTKSSGNSFRAFGISAIGNVCDSAKVFGLSCHSGAFEPSQNSPYYITVGALAANGKHASYSSAGPNLLVSAPAGEYGDMAPAMVTTDQMTCLRGYSSHPYVEAGGLPAFDAAFLPFNTPGHADNPSCNYTSTFNGTSSAAPNTAGVIALMLSANPTLSYREVRDILVRTSVKTDPTNSPVVLNVEKDLTPVDEEIWAENFDNSRLSGLPDWTLVDSDGDSYKWNIIQELDDSFAPKGTPFLDSMSYTQFMQLGQLNPDNWAITPEIPLTGLDSASSVELKWTINMGSFAQQPNGEHYSVYITTTDNVHDISDAQKVYSKRNLVNETITVDLSAYRGQTVRIAFRHHDVTYEDNITASTVVSSMGIDDVKVVALGVTPSAVASVTNTSTDTEKQFVAHAGWVKNAAGYSYNNLYGFGRVNAGEAVRLAKNYTTRLPAEQVSNWIGAGTTIAQDSLALPIPDVTAGGVTHSIEVAESSVIEAMQFRFDVFNAELQSLTQNLPSQTTAGIDLAVEVTSPAGTKAILLSSKQAIVEPSPDMSGMYSEGYIMKNSVILSNAFYGENAKGIWTVRLVDTNGNDLKTIGAAWRRGYKNNKTDSVLEGWAIRVFGH